MANHPHGLPWRWWIVALAVLVVVAGLAAAALLPTRHYRATTRLLISSPWSVSTIHEVSRRQLDHQRAEACAQIATTGPAVQAAVDAAGVSGGNPQVTATAPGNDPFVVLSVTSTSPEAAQAVANAYAGTLNTALTALEQAPSAVSLSVTVLEPARLPTQPDGWLGRVLG